MIKLEETTTELLLFIPFNQKERAKAIDGRRWDPKRKCWTYPKTARIYDALIAEFGDDLLSIDIRRPPSVADRVSQTENIQQENKLLKKDMAAIQDRSEQLFKTRSDNTRLNELESALMVKDRELMKTRHQLATLQQEIQAARSSLSEAQTEIQRLQQVTLQEKSTNKPDQFKQTAIDATGGNSKFAELVSRLSNDRTLPIDLANELEGELRKILNTTDTTLHLWDLLMEAKDADILSQEAIDLAHIIRKQRNIVVHNSSYGETNLARVPLCLFAASLLWPELPG